MWEIEYTHEFEEWWTTLSTEQQEAIDDRVMLLAEHGPALKRPVVADIKSSRHPNMKELRASKRGPFACCSRSIRAGTQSCCWEETSRGNGRVGMRQRFQRWMTSMTFICRSYAMRVDRRLRYEH